MSILQSTTEPVNDTCDCFIVKSWEIKPSKCVNNRQLSGVTAWDLVIMELYNIAIVNDLFDIYRHRPTNFESHGTFYDSSN